jgi:hypothetical protein
MVLCLAGNGAATTPSITNFPAMVEKAALLVQWRTQIRLRLSLRAGFVANLERAQCALLPRSFATVIEILQLIKAEADRWIEVGAGGPAALARG